MHSPAWWQSAPDQQVADQVYKQALAYCCSESPLPLQEDDPNCAPPVQESDWLSPKPVLSPTLLTLSGRPVCLPAGQTQTLTHPSPGCNRRVSPSLSHL